MDILEIHKRFRALAQQQGMQTTRAILPENIDIVLNNVIMNKVRSIVLSDVEIDVSAKEKVTQQDNPMIATNALRTLYTYKTFSSDKFTGSGVIDNPYSLTLVNDEAIMFYTGVSVSYSDGNKYNCRIIDGQAIEDTMNDFCNRASKDAPIADIVISDDVLSVAVYNDDSANKPSSINIRYIKEPATVKHPTYDGDTKVDCDLPDYLIPEIIKLAVAEFNSSIGATAHNI